MADILWKSLVVLLIKSNILKDLETTKLTWGAKVTAESNKTPRSLTISARFNFKLLKE